VQYQRDKLFLNLQGYVVGDRARIPIDLRSEPDDYVRLNLLGRYDLTQDLSLQLEIRNLLNTNDQEASAGVVALGSVEIQDSQPSRFVIQATFRRRFR